MEINTKMFSPPLHSISAPGLVEHIIKLGPDLVGCELGICRGHNLRFLLDRAPNIKKVYAIDPWLAYQDWNGFVNQDIVDSWKEEAIELLQDYDEKIVVLLANSDNSVRYIQDDSLDYIFVDGDHSYETTKTDCLNYYPKVKSKGLFSGHDWQLPDVKKAVNDFRDMLKITTEIQFADNNAWFWYKD